MKKTSALMIAAMLPLTAAEASPDDQKIRDYLMRHPEVIIESLQAYQAKQKLAQLEAAKFALTSERKNLVENPGTPWAGAEKDGITVVEFFDYRCGYCKKVSGTVSKLMADNPKVRVIYKEFPILGPESELAAKAALAAHEQGAYQKFHQALLEMTAGITPEAIEELAKGLKLDVAKLKSDMESAKVRKAIEDNARLAGALGVQSTPTFVVGSELVPGALDEAALKALIAKAAQPAPAAAAGGF